MAESSQLRSLSSEKWLNDKGFTKFIAAIFAAKCHDTRKSHLCRVYIGTALFRSFPYSKFMTTGEDRNKDWFRNWQLAVFDRSRFVTRKRQRSRNNAFALPMRVSIFLFCLFPSLMNTTQKYLNFSTYCSVLPLTCTGLSFWRRRRTSAFLVPIFIPVWSNVWSSPKPTTVNRWWATPGFQTAMKRSTRIPFAEFSTT